MNGSPPPQTDTPAQHKRQISIVVFGLTLLATMGISSVLPAMPLLSATFGFPIEESWRFIVAFTLPGLVCIPFVGIGADRFGRMHMLMPALFLFACGGVLCAFAQSYEQLLFFRVIQGLGGAPFGLLYPTIIADTWEGPERLTFMSRAAIVLGMGTAVSPIVGGALAAMDWRLPFFMPLSALIVAALAYPVSLMRPRGKRPLSEYLRQTLTSVTGRQTLVLLGLTLLTFIMLSGPVITCLPMLAENAFAARPLEIGVILCLSSLAAGLAASQLPRLYRHMSARTMLFLSFALYILAFCTMAVAPGLWWLVPCISVYGLAQGLNIPLASSLLTGQTTDGQRAGLMAANAIVLRLGQNIGPTLFGALAAFLTPAIAIACGSFIAMLMALLVISTPLPATLAHHSAMSSVAPPETL